MSEKGKKVKISQNVIFLDEFREKSRDIAAFAVIVDAKHGAEGFYLKYDFLPFPDEKNRLFLLRKTIESLI
jgi:hypothetical protein